MVCDMTSERHTVGVAVLYHHQLTFSSEFR
jgi:hypothetical protein